MFIKDRVFFHTSGNELEKFYIRKLTLEDIDKIALARKMQETENGNGASNKYILEYKKVLKKLFVENNVIGAGAFHDDNLVSLAFYNLINFGNEKKIPYLCGVWTNPEYRKKTLATQVYKKLMEDTARRKDELQTISIVTVEGNEIAHKLYNSLGYELVDDEMTFLGDVKSPKEGIEVDVSKLLGKDNLNEEIYLKNKKPQMLIQFSTEQFFPHPHNLNGIMNRILEIKLIDQEITPKEFRTYLQKFFSKHRFCKFSVKELMQKEKFGRIFDYSKIDKNYFDLMSAFEYLKFEGIDEKPKTIQRSANVMEKNLIKDFEYMDRCFDEDR